MRVDRLLLATRNKGKVEELEQIFRDAGLEVVLVTLEDYPEVGEFDETGDTFEENAFQKARLACSQTGMAAIADDSGLVVDALGGRPGIHSSRYAPTPRERNSKLLAELQGVPVEDRTARFVCVMAYVDPLGNEVSATGVCEGRIAFEPKGDKGFGYDPVFLLDDERTMAELDRQEKNLISHRGKAARDLAEKLKAFWSSPGDSEKERSSPMAAEPGHERNDGKMETPDNVPPQMLKSFDEAVRLAAEGRPEDALSAWEDLLSEAGRIDDLPLSFTGEALMRKAWAMMDIGLYEQAEVILDENEMGPYLDHFRDEVLFEYFFSYANLLGAMAKKEDMDLAMKKALYIASEVLGDPGRCVRSWLNLMLLAEHNGWWDYLERAAAAAQEFAVLNGSDFDSFWTVSGLHRLRALKSLDRLEQAMELGRRLEEKAGAISDPEIREEVRKTIRNIEVVDSDAQK